MQMKWKKVKWDAEGDRWILPSVYHFNHCEYEYLFPEEAKCVISRANVWELLTFVCLCSCVCVKRNGKNERAPVVGKTCNLEN